MIVAGRPVSPACVAYREEVYGDVEYDPRGREKTGQEAVHKGC